MQIFVKTLDGSTICLNVQPYNTVAWVKQKIRDHPAPTLEPLDSNWQKPTASSHDSGDKGVILEFVSSKKSSNSTLGKSFFMEDVSLSTTTLSECAHWLALQLQDIEEQEAATSVNRRQVTFVLGDSGPVTVPCCGKSFLAPSSPLLETESAKEATIGDFVCHDKPIMFEYVEDDDGTLGLADTAHLVFNGKPLRDKHTLRYYNFSEESTLHLVLPLKGGSQSANEFIDVTQSNALFTRAFAPAAPAWRCAGKGLNLEGCCTKKRCVAAGRRVVVPMGFSNFDLVAYEGKAILCPACQSPVKPTIPIFSACKWRISAVKKLSPDSAVWNKPWAKAADDGTYTSYDPKEAGYSSFSRLQIFVKPLSAEGTTCAICFEPMHGQATFEEFPARCGHYFHNRCVKAWPNSTCPVCRAEGEPTRVA